MSDRDESQSRPEATFAPLGRFPRAMAELRYLAGDPTPGGWRNIAGDHAPELADLVASGRAVEGPERVVLAAVREAARGRLAMLGKR